MKRIALGTVLICMALGFRALSLLGLDLAVRVDEHWHRTITGPGLSFWPLIVLGLLLLVSGLSARKRSGVDLPHSS